MKDYDRPSLRWSIAVAWTLRLQISKRRDQRLRQPFAKAHSSLLVANALYGSCIDIGCAWCMHDTFIRWIAHNIWQRWLNFVERYLKYDGKEVQDEVC